MKIGSTFPLFEYWMLVSLLSVSSSTNKLSKLSSLEDLRSEIASYLLAPHQNLVQLLNAAGTELVGIFNNYSKKN